VTVNSVGMVFIALSREKENIDPRSIEAAAVIKMAPSRMATQSTPGLSHGRRNEVTQNDSWISLSLVVKTSSRCRDPFKLCGSQ
jgi:hypothetical protein